MNKRSINILFLGFFLFVVSSCNKVEIPEPDINLQETPSLNLDFSLSGESLNFAAGNECVKMETGFNQDSLGIYSFKGSFVKNVDCDHSQIDFNRLTIELRDAKERENSNLISLDGIEISPYGYFTENILNEGFEVFIASFNPFFPFLNLELVNSEDENLDFESVFNHEYLLNNDIDWLKINARSLEDEIVASQTFYNREFEELDYNLAVACPDPTNLNLELFAALVFYESNNKELTYVWDDGTEGEGIVISIDSLSSSEVVERCVIISDEIGILAQSCITAEIDDFGFLCYHSLESDFASYPINSPSDELKTVIIEYEDQEGEIYSSVGLDQNQFFDILDITEFPDNPMGLVSKKLEVEFTCDLQNEDGAILSIENAKGNVAVSFPD